ncbi:MAG TPA: hypothetical protein DCS93_22630 [Microscillaceae bacterium]|nr:hypothetical protein [Microscillaceae bacterium]
MYNTLLFIHSWIRWIILVMAVIVIFKSLTGWLGKKGYTKGDNALSASFVGFMHLQLLLGLILYFVSPYAMKAIQSMGMSAVMKNPVNRFWAIEHITLMIFAVVLAQVGRSRAKKMSDTVRKHKTSFIFFTIAIILILASVLTLYMKINPNLNWFRM